MRMVRRNVGVLAELPQFEQGGAPMPQMSLLQQEMMAPAAEAEVLPASAGEAPPMTDTQRAEAAAAALIAAEERNRQLAGSPLNRVLSAVGGVIGAPLNFLSAALGEGDMRQVTAPFRPQQTADAQFQQRVLGIQDSLSKIRENAAQQQASLASATASGLQSRSNLMSEFNTSIANLALNSGRTANPLATWKAGLANIARDPMLGPLVAQRGYDQMDWTPDLAASLAITDKGATRMDANKPSNVVLPENSVLMRVDRDGNVVGVIEPNAVPGVQSTTPPAQLPPPPPGFVMER
jgi:hypothetical protein